MVSCAVRTCSSRNGVDKKKFSGITFHRFPKNPAQREAWVKFVGRGKWQPSIYSVLCSKHFLEKYIDRTSLCVLRLRPDAIPTLNTVILPSLHYPLAVPTQDSHNTKNIPDQTVSAYDDDNDPYSRVSSDDDSSFQELDDSHLTPSPPAQKEATSTTKSIATVYLQENEIKTETTADEFELFGRTVAAHLKQLPLHDALQSQADIMKYLVEKRLKYSSFVSPSVSEYVPVSSSCYRNDSAINDNPEIKTEIP